jgi:hypothetical protein
MKRPLIAAIFATFACASVHAQDSDRHAVPPVESIFSGLVQEQDVALAFSYLRDSLDAALDGRSPAPPSDALIERGQEITNELNRRGAAYARSVLDAIEAVVREGVRSAPGLPPSNPAQGI